VSRSVQKCLGVSRSVLKFPEVSWSVQPHSLFPSLSRIVYKLCLPPLIPDLVPHLYGPPLASGGDCERAVKE
jgi:hypothetical protein